MPPHASKEINETPECQEAYNTPCKYTKLMYKNIIK
jgi:hypothetical protein